MTTYVYVTASTVRNAVVAARERLGVKREDTPERWRNDDGDGLWSVALKCGITVRATIEHHARSVVHTVIDPA